MKMVPFDYSTINLEVLRELPVFREGAYHLQDEDHPGNGCILDAPGYPTYFTRSVYNSRGDSPRNGPYYVISDPERPEHHRIVDNVDLRTLWVPIPYPQVSSIEGLAYMTLPQGRVLRLYKWMRDVYIYYNHCYADPAKGEKRRNAGELSIISGPSRPGHPIYDPANHAAALMIQEFYPEHKPEIEWINKTPASEPQNDWWERYSDASLVVKPGAAAAYRPE